MTPEEYLRHDATDLARLVADGEVTAPSCWPSLASGATRWTPS